MPTYRWPARIWLIRHGQSVGNVADDAAKATGQATVSVEVRDPDVALTELGRRQAAAVGEAWARASRGDRPDVVVSSPFERASATARIALATSGLDAEFRLDERLRERDLGAFDGLTALGIRERYPAEAERRARLGKFYYRPPCGESWADVALRVRAVIAELRHDFGGRRVAIVSHQAVLFVLRYVLEGLTEREILDVDRRTAFHNGGMTCYAGDGRELRLLAHDDTAHLDAAGAPATEGHDVHVEV